MKITYHAPSGQKIRQNQEHRINKVLIEKRETDFEERSGVAGADSFTNKMWSNDVETIKRWCRDWSRCPDKLKFEIVDKTKH